MHRGERVKDAREGRIGDLVAPLSAIKNEIGAPQRPPLGAIRARNCAHSEIWQSPPPPLVLTARYARRRRIAGPNRLDKRASKGLPCPRRSTLVGDGT